MADTRPLPPFMHSAFRHLMDAWLTAYAGHTVAGGEAAIKETLAGVAEEAAAAERERLAAAVTGMEAYSSHDEYRGDDVGWATVECISRSSVIALLEPQP